MQQLFGPIQLHFILTARKGQDHFKNYHLTSLSSDINGYLPLTCQDKYLKETIIVITDSFALHVKTKQLLLCRLNNAAIVWTNITTFYIK